MNDQLGCFHTKVLLSPSYLMICAIDNSIHLRWHLSFPELFCRFNQFFFILPHCICIINLSSGQNKVLYMEPSSLFPCMIFHEVNKVDYALYIRQHITELRMKRNVSEYQMSLDLGQNKNYIQGISSGKALPSMSQFFNICDYFNITPMQFFDTESLHPELISSILSEMRTLDEEDLTLLLSFAHRMSHSKD